MSPFHWCEDGDRVVGTCCGLYQEARMSIHPAPSRDPCPCAMSCFAPLPELCATASSFAQTWARERCWGQDWGGLSWCGCGSGVQAVPTELAGGRVVLQPWGCRDVCLRKGWIQVPKLRLCTSVSSGVLFPFYQRTNHSHDFCCYLEVCTWLGGSPQHRDIRCCSNSSTDKHPNFWAVA